jgi:hypothetical protein
MDMEVSMIELSPQCPFRPPHWRWTYGRYRVERGMGVPPPSEGAWVRLAYYMNEVLLKLRSTEPPLQLTDWRADVVYAYQLWKNTHSLSRDAVEAFILARESSLGIARRFCIQVAAVEAYEALFFDVRDRLRHRAYVTGMLLGPELNGPLSETRFPAVLKAFGYNRGPLMVDALLGIYRSQIEPLEPVQLGTFLPASELIGLELRAKAAVAAMMLPINDKTAPILLKLSARILEMERRSGSPETAETERKLHEGLDLCFRDLRWAFEHVDAAPEWLRKFLAPAD